MHLLGLVFWLWAFDRPAALDDAPSAGLRCCEFGPEPVVAGPRRAGRATKARTQSTSRLMLMPNGLLAPDRGSW